MEIIRINGLTKTFNNRKIIDNMNFTVSEGEMIAVTGKSGTGKTTLLNIIGLIENFDEGNYWFYDQLNVKPNSKEATLLIRNHISYLFQNFALIDDESILNNLLIGLEFKNLNKKEKIEEINNVLQRVNIQHELHTKVSSLSGGEQQRVAIARLILKQGQLILADEPTGSLDEENREVILSLLKELNRDGKTIIIVTHDLYVANKCDRIISL
ncbi:ABC transporter ATP-binding protein [Beduini massiliensis]|uniref:ABC transporter ATP-binding protein n=1 Tax=Beduini massiliensis TaxID=1585974 RepID=UPI000B163C01|nr:ABC transporter ATP-binding protein [Beduini massiliensis]